MTVAELIEHLKTFQQDLQVTYRIHSEQCILAKEDVGLEWNCQPRPDGWVQNYRKDQPHQQYVSFPGN